MIYRSFEIISQKSPGEIIEILETIIEVDGKSEIKNVNTQYYRPLRGRLNSKYFNVWGNYPNINSFRPEIIGEIRQLKTGSKIRIRMHMVWFVVAFLAIFTLFAIFSTPMILLIDLVAIIAFNIEAHYRKKELLKALT